MSEGKEVQKSKFALVNIIMAALNLGDNGKIESFFDRAIKQLKREISHITSNFNVTNLADIQAAEDLKSEIEDAQTELDEAYLNIDVTRLDSNSSQDAYREVYFGGIEAAENKFEALTNKLKDLNVNIKDATKTRDESIANLKARIAKISK